MLFSLGEPFQSLVSHLGSTDLSHVELLDEGLHTLNARRVKTLKEVAQSRGVEFSLHSPFADINIASPTTAIRRAILRRQEKSISYASKLDCRLWVFHPGLKTAVSPFYPGLEWQLNLDSVDALMKIAEEKGVDMAIENVPEPYPFLMKSVEDFSRFFNEFDRDLGIVLDLGHANINGQIQAFISHFSDKIVHMHASDNDGSHDRHLGIGYGTIDWETVAKAVKNSKYDGLIVLESIEHVRESISRLQELFI